MGLATNYQALCNRFYRQSVRVIAPRLRYSQDSYAEALTSVVGPGVRWLDLGCGHQVLPEWRFQQESALVRSAALVIGADRDLAAMRSHRTVQHRVGSDIRRLPFAPGSFDLVTANMVVEHLDAPALQFREICRVLAPGGTFLFHTGNIFGYYILCSRLLPESLKVRLAGILQDREAVDVYPTYYRANSDAAIQRLSQAAGFRVHEVSKIPSTPQTIPLPLLLPFELLWIRMTTTRALQSLRTNLIVTLRKPDAQGAAA